jgi:hypothetical protein
MEQLCSYWTDFHEILNFSLFTKYDEGIKFSSKFDKNNGCLHEGPYTFMAISHSVLRRKWNFSEKC